MGEIHQNVPIATHYENQVLDLKTGNRLDTLNNETKKFGIESPQEESA